MNPDPRLTAYALGELDPAEREAFERDLATSPELQAELSDTIALVEGLPASLVDFGHTLGDERRRMVSSARIEAKKRPVLRIWLPALAAGVLAALAVLALFTKRSSRDAPFAAAPMPGVDLMTAPTVSIKSGGKIVKVPIKTAATPIADQPDPAKENVTRLLTEGDAFFKTGRYDLAFKRAEQVLDEDRHNIPARRLREKVTSSRETYAQNVATANETRARLPLTASVAGQMPVSQSLMVDRVAAPAEVEAWTANPVPAAKAERRSGAVLFTKRSGVQPSLVDSPQRLEPAGHVDAESYESPVANAFLESRAHPLSTFSIDVDTASYANVRRFLTNGQLPPTDAVRLEELINYFPYALPQPEGDAPFSVTTEVSRAPWHPGHLLARIALKGRDLDAEKLPASNLVFLVDVSGSMDEPNKLPLLKRSLRELVTRLDARDRVAIVTYAGNSGLALASTGGREQARILDAIDRLEPGGSTNGAAGIQLAYDQAREHFLRDGNNRVILCTDGDFNVGVTSQDELTQLIERERKSGVFLSVLGFGTGNLKDATMENLADKGNGNYAYIDSPSEGRKVLVEQIGATLFAIAKDVKIQVEFNPATVAGYRLIGYENRLLAKEDFNDDTKDAGEIGAGHAVTALYEIVPVGETVPGQPSVDPLKYQAPERPVENRKSKIENSSPDLFTVKLRYKAPDGDTSRLIEKVVGPDAEDFARASADFRFAAAVAAFGMKLRGDRHDAAMSWSDIQRTARESLGDDAGSYRAEFLVLVEKARQLGE